MNLKITSTVITSSGLQVANAIGVLSQHAYTDEQGNLIVPSDIKWYKDLDSMNNGLDQIIPCLMNNDGTIKSRITSSNITLTEQQAAAAGLPYTIYQASAANLISLTSWSITVEL